MKNLQGVHYIALTLRSQTATRLGQVSPAAFLQISQPLICISHKTSLRKTYGEERHQK